MRRIPPEEWRPAGIEDLEPAAWRALRKDGNTCVVAGPGAGKTEFLAQRAAYLLQTGICDFPNRILAISFKRDAKRNLAERIAQRCPPEQAARFDSMTYDGFAKSLVDRFLPAIPGHWRPDRHYQIVMPKVQDYRAFLDRESVLTMCWNLSAPSPGMRGCRGQLERRARYDRRRGPGAAHDRPQEQRP